MAKAKRARVRFDRITDSAGELLMDRVGMFLTDFPNWNERRLLLAVGMDPRLLQRIQDGQSFQTKAADAIQIAIECVYAGKTPTREYVERERATRKGTMVVPHNRGTKNGREHRTG